MRCFLDCEFTGLHQRTTLISIGCVAEDGARFYAELDDYATDQVDDWLMQNVIKHLWIQQPEHFAPTDVTYVVDNVEPVAAALAKWLLEQSTKNAVYGDMRNQFPDRHPQKLEMWSDCLAYDWVLFCDLFGGALNIPNCVYYIPFDLATLFKVKGIDPDINREEYAGLSGGNKHSALWDAQVIKACYDKLMATRGSH